MSDLYHASYRRLVAQVYAFTTDLNEAQDAVQEAFARALARRHKLSDVDAPEAWLRTVAINIVRRRWRRKQLLNTILLRERPLAKMLEDAPEPDRADLRDALATLPRSYREVIVLHYLADLPVDEVAALLEVPVGTVKSRLSRGRDALKGLLDDVEAPPMDRVRRRAGEIRTRRQVVRASAALAMVCVSLIGFFALRPPPGTPPISPSPTPTVAYAGSGITIHGIFDAGTAPDLRGSIVDVNADGRGYLRTDTGNWFQSTDGGQTWTEIADPGPPPAKPKPNLFEPTWYAPRPTPSGVLWAGVVNNPDTPSASLFAAYSTDGGNDWTTIGLVGHGEVLSSTNVAFTLSGEKVIAIGTGNGVIQRVWEVTTAGATVIRSSDQGVKLSGEPIVLPDGRFLIAGTESEFMLSSDQGATWTPAGGTLPFVGSLRANANGYVAFDLFRTGWVATSPDGVVWHKLPVH